MDSTIIEVAIGLAVVFLIVSSIAAAVNEVITRLLNTRSKMLWAGIAGLLEGDATKRPSIGLSFIWKALPSWLTRPLPKRLRDRLSPEDCRPKPSDAKLDPTSSTCRTAQLHNTASIRGIGYVRGNEERTKVWTIAPAVFSAAVLEIAETKAAGKSLEDKVKALSADWKDAPLGHYLAGAAATIGGSTDKFVDGLGEWFDGQMQSLANTYRRLSRWTLWALGLVVAFAFNVDTIQIADSLYDDEHTRAAVVAFADELELCSEQNTDGSEPSEEDVDLGEQPVAVCDTVDGVELGRGQLNDLSELGIPVLGEWTSPFAGPISRVAGILLTSLLVAFGSQFWFDFVRQLTGLRRRT